MEFLIQPESEIQPNGFECTCFLASKVCNCNSGATYTQPCNPNCDTLCVVKNACYSTKISIN